MKKISIFILLIATMHAVATPASKDFIIYREDLSSILKAEYKQYVIVIDTAIKPSKEAIENQGLFYDENSAYNKISIFDKYSLRQKSTYRYETPSSSPGSIYIALIDEASFCKKDYVIVTIQSPQPRYADIAGNNQSRLFINTQNLKVEVEVFDPTDGIVSSKEFAALSTVTCINNIPQFSIAEYKELGEQLVNFNDEF